MAFSVSVYSVVSPSLYAYRSPHQSLYSQTSNSSFEREVTFAISRTKPATRSISRFAKPRVDSVKNLSAFMAGSTRQLSASRVAGSEFGNRA